MSFGKLRDDYTSDLSKTTTTSTSPRSAAFLGQGTKVVGNLSFSGQVELDGNVEGEINAQDKLTIGESAVIKAKVIGVEIIVKGTVHGDIHASKRLSLLRPAKIIGNIVSSNLSIEEGVVFEGQCSMSAASSSEDLKRPATKLMGSEKIASLA